MPLRKLDKSWAVSNIGGNIQDLSAKNASGLAMPAMPEACRTMPAQCTFTSFQCNEFYVIFISLSDIDHTQFNSTITTPNVAHDGEQLPS